MNKLRLKNRNTKNQLGNNKKKLMRNGKRSRI